jgi:predicted Zn-dependent peptidase
MMRRSVLVGFALANLLASCGSAPPPAPALRVQHGDLPKPWTLASETPDAPFRAHAPELGPVAPFGVPKILDQMLPNGVRVLFVERHDVPLVQIEFVVTRGAADAPAGVAGFASAMIFQGTSSRSDRDVGSATAGLGVSAWVHHDAYGLTVSSFGSNLNYRFPALCGLFQSASLPPERFEQTRKRRLALLAEITNEGDDILERAIAEKIYPEGHPYHQTVLGDENALRSITREQVLDFYRSQLRPDQMVVVAAGDITRQVLIHYVTDGFNQWHGKANSRAPAPPQVTTLPPGDPVVLIDRPSFTQATLRLAAPGIARTHPDFETLNVLNMILGQAFTSRLMKNLREQRGAAYRASSSLSARRGAGPFVVGGEVPTEEAGDSIRAIREELDRLRTTPVTADELALAKAGYLRSVALEFSSVDGTVDALYRAAIYEQGPESIASLPHDLDAVVPQRLQRVAKEYLAPDRFKIFVVGDAKRLAPQLAKL